jgi:hypothetical protein
MMFLTAMDLRRILIITALTRKRAVQAVTAVIQVHSPHFHFTSSGKI